MVTVCVSLTLPVKLKLDGDTVTDTPAGASTTAFQVVATPRVLRKVRTQTHSPGQLVKRMLGKFRVRGFPPVLGSEATKLAKVSFITRPDSSALLRSTRPLPTCSGFHGVAASDHRPSRFAVNCMADLTSCGVQVGCAERISAAEPAVCGEDIEVPVRKPNWALPPDGAMSPIAA